MMRYVVLSTLDNRRRADELAALLEGGSASGSDPAVVALADLTRAFSRIAAPEPDAAFRSGLRARLVDEAATRIPTSGPAISASRAAPVRLRVHPHSSTVRRQLAASGVALTLVVGTGVLVSNTALPGDDLYPIKRSVENVQLSIARSDHDRGVHLLDQADTRTREVQQLLTSDAAQDPGSVKRTSRAMTEALHNLREGRALLLKAYAGGDVSAIRTLDTFLATQRALLDSLVSVVPASLRPQLEQLRQEVDTAVQAARDARDQCTEPCRPDTASRPAAKDLEPVPGPADDVAPVASVVSSDNDSLKAERDLPPVASGAVSGPVTSIPSSATASDAGRPNFMAPQPPSSGSGSVPSASGTVPAAPVVPSASTTVAPAGGLLTDGLPGADGDSDSPTASSDVSPSPSPAPVTETPVVTAPSTSPADATSPEAPAPSATATDAGSPAVAPAPVTTTTPAPVVVTVPPLVTGPSDLIDPPGRPDPLPSSDITSNVPYVPAGAAHGVETSAVAHAAHGPGADTGTSDSS